MPEAPVTIPAKADAPAPAPSKTAAPVATSAPTNPPTSGSGRTDARQSGYAKTAAPAATQPRKPDASASGSDQPDGSHLNLPKVAPAVIALGVATAVLFVIVVVTALKLADRNTTIEQNKNRADQYEATTSKLQTQLDADKT